MLRLRAFVPAAMAVDGRERLRMVIGAGLGIGLTAAVCHLWAATPGLTWIIAPMGASAVLVFCVPASPLAQPWSVVGGNVVSALAGVFCARLFGPTDLAVAAAVALAIAAMLALRCLHPPGGATALLLSIGGIADSHAVLMPVLLNSVLLTAGGVAYNNLTGRAYPHRPAPAERPAEKATEGDLDVVLAHYNQVLDVSRGDLREIFSSARLRASERWLASTRCADIMTRAVTTVELGTPLQDAWTLLRQRGVEALPVVDKWQHLVGIVTLADFLRAADIDRYRDLVGRLRDLVRKSGLTHTDRHEVVGQIMTRRVRVTGEQRLLADLLPLFGGTGHHHIPVIGEGERLVGMITQADVIAALAAGDPAPFVKR